MKIASGLPRVPTWSAMLLLAVSCAASVGCGPPTATVTGSVRLDGQPIDAGTVVFHSTDRNYRVTKGADVNGGRYRIDGLPIKPMDVETALANSTTPVGKRIRVELKPGKQVLDIDLTAPRNEK